MQFFKVLFIAAISAVVVADSTCASDYNDCISGKCCDGWHCTGDNGWFSGVCIRDDYNICKDGGC